MWGNETIRWHPIEEWLEIKLPAPLAHLANRPHGRYRLSSQVSWPHRADEVAAQATSGALRYDISFDPAKRRWYIDASWKTHYHPVASLEQLRRGPVVAVDLNVGHLAVAVLDCYGNPLGAPTTIPLVLNGLEASHRDGLIGRPSPRSSLSLSPITPGRSSSRTSTSTLLASKDASSVVTALREAKEERGFAGTSRGCRPRSCATD